jgi:hypothetical protein
MTEASWIVGQDGEPELKALYDRHYSARKYRDGRIPVGLQQALEKLKGER